MATRGRFFEPPPGSFLLLGPRGTGKSTWIRERFPNAETVDLLVPDVLRDYTARPERLEDRARALPDDGILVLDEVQRVPQLLDVVHSLMMARPGLRFVMTGSSARKLRRAGVNLLAGRAVHRSLHPFLAAELGDEFELDRAIRHGLVPLVWSASTPEDTLRSYLGLYVREEVQQESLVRDIGGFSRFLEAVSLTHGNPRNLSAIAAECQVSRKTVDGYLDILHELLLCFSVPVFQKRAKRALTTHPKLYWFDCGVFAAARPRGFLDRPEEIAGAALEGLVAQHLRAWIDYSQADLRLYFWRTRAGNEVDFVLYGGSGFHAIEVKSAERIRGEDLRGLRAFGADYPEATRTVLYRGREELVLDGVRCQPVERLLRSLRPDQPFPIAPAPSVRSPE